MAIFRSLSSSSSPFGSLHSKRKAAVAAHASRHDLSPRQKSIAQQELTSKKHKLGEFVETNTTIQGIVLLVILIDVFSVWSEILLTLVTTPTGNNSPSSQQHDAAGAAQEDIIYCNTTMILRLEHIFRTVSLIALAILSIEIWTLFYCYGRNFWSHAAYAVDLVVITLSLVFELFFLRGDEIGILIVWMLWRFVRVVHGVVDSFEIEVLVDSSPADAFMPQTARFLRKQHHRRHAENEEIIDDLRHELELVKPLLTTPITAENRGEGGATEREEKV